MSKLREVWSLQRWMSAKNYKECGGTRPVTGYANGGVENNSSMEENKRIKNVDGPW